MTTKAFAQERGALIARSSSAATVEDAVVVTYLAAQPSGDSRPEVAYELVLRQDVIKDTPWGGCFALASMSADIAQRIAGTGSPIVLLDEHDDVVTPEVESVNVALINDEGSDHLVIRFGSDETVTLGNMSKSYFASEFPGVFKQFVAA